MAINYLPICSFLDSSCPHAHGLMAIYLTLTNNPDHGLSINTLFSVAVGGLISIFTTLIFKLVDYRYHANLKSKQEESNARESALLIRSWLLERIDRTCNIKMHLIKKNELVDEINDEFFKNFSQHDRNMRDKLVTVTGDMEDPVTLYDFNSTYIEKLSIVRHKFNDYEVVIQLLAGISSAYNKAKNISNDFNRYKKEIYNNKINDSFEHVLLTMIKRNLPSWLEIVNQSENFLSTYFIIFNHTICKPLGIPVASCEDADEVSNTLDNLRKKYNI